MLIFDQLYCAVGRTKSEKLWDVNVDELGYVNQHGLSRKVSFNRFNNSDSSSLRHEQHIFDSVKASLERLQLDYIDVLQCTSISLIFFGPLFYAYPYLQATALTRRPQSKRRYVLTTETGQY